jgi:hypothetical protein
MKSSLHFLLLFQSPQNGCLPGKQKLPTLRRSRGYPWCARLLISEKFRTGLVDIHSASQCCMLVLSYSNEHILAQGDIGMMHSSVCLSMTSACINIYIHKYNIYIYICILHYMYTHTYARITQTWCQPPLPSPHLRHRGSSCRELQSWLKTNI